MPETVSDNYLRIFNEEIPEILKTCDGIITVSEFSKQDISNAFNFPKEKIYVTYLAAEEIYKPMSKSQCKKNIQKKYGISSDFILFKSRESAKGSVYHSLVIIYLSPSSFKFK